MPVPHRSPERAALLAACEEVAPIASAHAAESERLSTLAPPVVEALRRAGLFACASPRAVGGAEVDPLTQMEIFEAVARADTSAGWSLMIGSLVSAMAAAYLPERGARALFAPGPFPIAAGLQSPSGLARRAPGGFVITGRWGFGSGIRHADWVLSSAVVESDAPPSGPPEMVTFAVPRAQVTIEDTWDTAGLRGSGSDHYRMESVFVSSDFVYAFPSAAPQRGGPFFRLPFMPLLAPAHIGFALGAGRRALDEIARVAPSRVRIWTGGTLGDHPGFLMDLGRAEARLRAARALAFEAVGALWDRARAGEDLSLEEAVGARVAIAHVTDVAAEVAAFAYRSGGAGALYASSPLQRCFRDLHAATQHVAAGDDAYEVLGRARLGRAEVHPLLVPRRTV